ncbi:unannotated protein [freshwater metagenome]|uniref:Unannotated protein n=1 Tax=freshwater metagenome TaxID=449393 RepID=A0A6J7FLA0_9ZZZZ|nr:DUF2303 family protein [Actinomycetota bacterium]
MGTIEGKALRSIGPDLGLVQELTERAGAVETLAASPTNNVTTAVAPVGHGIALIDHEATSAAPDRARGFAIFTELEPFGRYVNAHRTDWTTAWLSHDPDNLGGTSAPIGRLVAVIDDHHPTAEPGWGEHRAVLQIATTPQWRHWLSGHKKWFDQDAFSEHLREGLSEILSPDAATILEVAENLTVTENQTLQSVVRGGGDLKISHTAEQTARSGSGKTETEIPEVFTLSIAPFAGAEPVEIQARLKYKNRGGTLVLGYTLVRPLERLRDAVDRLEAAVRDQLHGELTDRIYRGSPIDVEERRQALPTVEITTVPEA